MSLLQAIRAKKKERLTIKHLLHTEDISLRYAYSVGNAMLAFLDGKMSTSEINIIEDLAYSLGLSEEETKSTIEVAKQQDPSMIDTILESISEKEHQYLFLLDLYKTALIDGNLTDEKEELIEALADMMYFSDEEKTFIKNYSKAVYEKNQIKARDALNNIYNQNIEPPFNVLKFFMPYLDFKQEIDSFTLGQGEVFQFTRPSIIKGPIVVPSGSKLVINGIDLLFDGLDAHICVDGGQLELCDSVLVAGDCCGDVLIKITNVANFVIENTTFSGKRKKSALFMKRGNLEIIRCTFKNLFSVDYGGAIYLNQVKSIICKSSFEDCISLKNGGAIFLEESTLDISDNCSFKNCEAKGDGGGVYAVSAKLNIQESNFINCLGEYGGGIMLLECKGVIRKCYFEKCASGSHGGAIYLSESWQTNSEECDYINCKPDEISYG